MDGSAWRRRWVDGWMRKWFDRWIRVEEKMIDGWRRRCTGHVIGSLLQQLHPRMSVVHVGQKWAN